MQSGREIRSVPNSDNLSLTETNKRDPAIKSVTFLYYTVQDDWVIALGIGGTRVRI
jgi:hypothetical protein